MIILKPLNCFNLFVLCHVLLNALLVPLNSFQSVLAIEIYHMNAYVLSVLGVMMTIGMSLGSFIYPLIEKKSSVKFILLSCLMMQGLFYISLIMLKKLTSTIMIFYIVLSIISFVFGIFVAMGSSCVSVVTMKTIKKEYIARLMAIISAIATLCLPMTSFILGIVSHYISISMIFIFFGMMCIILTLLLIKLNFKEYF